MKVSTRTGISASSLRLLALTFMLLDHMWATIVPGNNWMTYAGRLAFPIFAFQIVEGFYHTSDPKRYVRRLLLLALVSEVPFNLIVLSSPLFPFHQNTVFTLLLGLWAISALDRAKMERSRSAAAKAGLVVAAACLLGLVGFVDYGWKGVMTVVAFYLFHEGRFAKAGQLVSLLLLNVILFEGQTLPLFGGLYDLPTQAFALLALIPIWLYDGRKGFGGKTFQTAAYLFYPVHLLVLHLIRTFF